MLKKTSGKPRPKTPIHNLQFTVHTTVKVSLKGMASTRDAEAEVTMALACIHFKIDRHNYLANQPENMVDELTREHGRVEATAKAATFT